MRQETEKSFENAGAIRQTSIMKFSAYTQPISVASNGELNPPPINQIIKPTVLIINYLIKCFIKIIDKLLIHDILRIIIYFNAYFIFYKT